MAAEPWLWRLLRSTAEAVPVGNLRRSRLIMLRFMGMARLVPRMARKNTHAPITAQCMPVPRGFSGVTVSSSSAGIADTSVPPVAYPAAEAVDCMQLFSRMVIGDRAIPALWKKLQIEYDRMQADRVTPRCQPIFRPMYTLVKARKKPRTAPMATARTVSCGASSPRYTLSYQASSSSSATSSGDSSSGGVLAMSSSVRGAG